MTRRCPLWVWRLQFLGLFADGDMGELEEELKLLLEEAKPDPISLLPEVPPGVLQPSGGSGLLDSLPAVPHTPVNICEQLKRLTVTDTGRHSAVSLPSSKKKTFIYVSFSSLFRLAAEEDSGPKAGVMPAQNKKTTFICTLLLYIKNILIVSAVSPNS